MGRQARYDAQSEGNTACCVVLLVLECVIGCIGDILEYFSDWAYVQVAVRGVSFVQAARITYSFFTCSNMEYVIQDLLVNSVVNLGAMLCGAVGCAVGAAAGCFWGSKIGVVVASAGMGFWSGLVAGGNAAGILSSGAKTILALWAEDPEPLRKTHPEIHSEFESRILSRVGY